MEKIKQTVDAIVKTEHGAGILCYYMNNKDKSIEAGLLAKILEADVDKIASLLKTLKQLDMVENDNVTKNRHIKFKESSDKNVLFNIENYFLKNKTFFESINKKITTNEILNMFRKSLT